MTSTTSLSSRLDFIKSERRRDEFLRTCPELVIVDEAHTCAYGGEGRGGRHQRHQLILGLADPAKGRHLILVTATPHSGNEQAFRSLLKLLHPDFANLPEDLTGKGNEQQRRRLAAHLVQRRRGDIRHFLKSETPFPDREDTEETYKLTDDYRRLFAKVLEYARETVAATGGATHRQRVQWWSVLALLRALASSPIAAAATLRTRAATLDTETAEEADELGRRTVLDLLDDNAAEAMDVVPGSDTGAERRRRYKEPAPPAGNGPRGRITPGRQGRQAPEGHSHGGVALARRLSSNRVLPVHRHGGLRGRRPPEGV